MSEREALRIVNEAGERLAFTYTAGGPVEGCSARTPPDDLVVIGHGVTSDRDRPWSEALSTALAAEGIASIRIAFAGNGESEGRFEAATITKEVADLGAVLGSFPDRRLHYVGHSMGGAVGLVRASRDPRIRSLVSLAAVTHTAEFGRRMFGHLRPGEPMLGKAHCPWGTALEADFEGLGSLVGRRPIDGAPWLIAHGSADEVVPLRDSLDLHRAAAEASELVELEGLDHSFNSADSGGSSGLGRLVEAVVPWLAGQIK